MADQQGDVTPEKEQKVPDDQSPATVSKDENPKPEGEGDQGKKAPENNNDNNKSDLDGRMNQLLARAKKAEEGIKSFQLEKDNAAEAELVKKGEHQEIIDNLKVKLADSESKSSRIGGLETALQSHLDSQMQNVAEDKRALIPESFTTEEKLTYISKNSAFLFENTPKVINSGGSLPKNDTPILNEIEKTQETYDRLFELKGNFKNYLDKKEFLEASRKLEKMKKEKKLNS